MPPLSRILSTAAIALLPVASFGGPRVDPTCVSNPGQADSCVPLVGCIQEAGIYFTGRALGTIEGTVAGVSNAGFACSGHWQFEGPMGLGEAMIECDNGLTGVAYFSYQDPVTGTARGFGAMSNGLSLQVWSGHNIRQFVINQAGDVNAKLLCGDLDIPIG